MISPVQVVLAEDQAILRDGLRLMLESQGSDFRIVAEAENGKDALQKASTLKPDLMLLDIGMPFFNGTEVLAEIKRRSPTTKVLMINPVRYRGIRPHGARSGCRRLFHQERRPGSVARCDPKGLEWRALSARVFRSLLSKAIAQAYQNSRKELRSIGSPGKSVPSSNWWPKANAC